MTYHLADVFGLRGELVAVLLLVLLHSSVHLLPLHLLLPTSERTPPLHHLVDETAQSKPKLSLAHCTHFNSDGSALSLKGGATGPHIHSISTPNNKSEQQTKMMDIILPA